MKADRIFRLTQHLRAEGPSFAVDLLRKNVAALIRRSLNRGWDLWFGVDTAGVLQLKDLTCVGDTSSSLWYEPTPIRVLRRMSRFVPRDLSDFTMVDFGSGKGRTLLRASFLNFREIIGVEFSEELHAIASRNIHTFHSRRQRCHNLTSVRMNASEFTIPDSPCVLYFFHPFGEETMSRVVRNIECSYRRNPRPMIVLYYHPRVGDLLKRHTFLRKRTEVTMPLDLSAEPCIYRRRLAIFETAEVR